VGIGTLAPNILLDVAQGGVIGNSTVSVGQHDPSNRGTKVSFGYNTFGNEFAGMRAVVNPGLNNGGNSGDVLFYTWENNTSVSREVMRINGNGAVAMGTTTPNQARLTVVGSFPFSQGIHGFLATTGAGGNAPGNTVNTSIYADQAVAANSFQAFSDERIKQIQGRSDAAADLATLQGIEVTDYSHVDTVNKGTGKHKKVIAQQVEKVFPQAVSKRTDVVPDIYQKATIKDGWVQLATKLKKGDRVRLIGEKKEAIHEVLEIAEGKFRTDFTTEGDKVFVYGREVNDFRTVDYEAIAMLNVSATQELARKLAAKEAEFTKLRAELTQLRTEKGALADKLAAVEARDQAREARLARLELALQETSADPKAGAQARGQTPGHTRELTSLTK
jgi:hypothetical protein